MKHESLETPEGPMILDIGGEGRHPEAWNLNPRIHKTLGKERGALIPRLIQGRGECIPLENRTVDVLIVERTPLREATLAEILRVARPAAKIILRHAVAHQRDPHRVAVRVLKGEFVQQRTKVGNLVVQETVIQLPLSRMRRAASMPSGTRGPLKTAGTHTAPVPDVATSPIGRT